MHNRFFPWTCCCNFVAFWGVCRHAYIFVFPTSCAFFPLFVKSLVLTNLSCVEVPQETLRLYSIWNIKKLLEVKMLVWCSVLQRMNKFRFGFGFFFSFAHCGLRTKISFYKKKIIERDTFIFMFPCGSLIYLFVSSSYINVKDTCQ